MALSRPVLTTYIAGIPELVRSGESGWLFPAGSVDELVLAMQDCLVRPAAQLQQFALRAASACWRGTRLTSKSASWLSSCGATMFDNIARI